MNPSPVPAVTSPQSPLSIAGKFNWPIIAAAILAWLSIVICLDPAGSYPNMPEGPGLAVDEIFNAEQGVYLMETARTLGWLNLVPGTSQEAFRPDNGYYNPDHPPLGRYWLGLHHQLTWWLFPPSSPDGLIVTACARTGSATAFALTVLLIGGFTTAWYGRLSGTLAAISLVLMPRVYGHAHLACLESITNLTCTLAVLAIAHGWAANAAPTWRIAALSGGLLGLALLTKIQAVLIPIPVIVWALWRWRMKSVLPLALWGMTALIVFLAGWPYLWFAPVLHTLEYLGRTTHRATIHLWYFGQRYPDTQAPWHYPFVMFALTVPVLLHALGLFGLFRALFTRRSGEAATATSSASSDSAAAYPRDVLLLMSTLFPMIVFTLPGVAVYDGERLFLTSFPLWAIFVGRGAAAFWKSLNAQLRSPALATATCTALLAYTALPLVTAAPCHLCYYNEVIWLLGGVDRAGMEVDYWGEGITRKLLNRVVQEVPKGKEVAVIPTLHPFQADDYYRQSPILRSYEIKTIEFQDKSQPEYILVYRRLADLPQNFAQPHQLSRWTPIEVHHEAYFARHNN